MQHRETSSLADLQRRLWRLVTAPEGVARALAESGDEAGTSLDTWLVSDGRLSALRRLEVYANAYFYRIRDALAGTYDTLAAALGEEPFHDLVTAYLCVYPPSHPSLRHAGARLPDYLATASGAEPFRRRWPWAADLARLERARADAFDAPDAPLLRREVLAALPPERWPELRLHFDASLEPLHLGWPVHELREAFEREAPLPSLAAPAPTALAVWRRRERVRQRVLAPPEAEMLALAKTGAPFEVLCRTAAAALGEPQAAVYAADRLDQWLRDAWLVVRDA